VLEARAMATEQQGIDGGFDEMESITFRTRQLSELLERHRGERHAIVLQDYPDPDAMSSGLAHRMICDKREIDVDLLYEGRVSHQENLALLQLLEVPLVRVSDETDLREYQHSVFVDNQGTTSNLTSRLAKLGIKPLIIVDHHEPQGLIKAEFEDIRKIGATATIYTEYLRSGLLTLSRSNPHHVRLATALMHGLRSESDGLIQAGVEDMEAATYLAPFIDSSLLKEILHTKRSKRVMEMIRDALANRVVVESYSISGIGYLRDEDRDGIPQAADFLMTEENVHTAIVYGIVLREGGEAVNGSMRTTKLTLDVDTFLKETLGGSTPGHYYGGGRRGAGGFEIPVGFLAGQFDEVTMASKWRIFEETIKGRLLEKVGARKPKATTNAPITGTTEDRKH
jgi:nanoRNase/pAp phosphatase (c-di-AMP/oligoRNAs hydrolase)